MVCPQPTHFQSKVANLGKKAGDNLDNLVFNVLLLFHTDVTDSLTVQHAIQQFQVFIVARLTGQLDDPGTTTYKNFWDLRNKIGGRLKIEDVPKGIAQTVDESVCI